MVGLSLLYIFSPLSLNDDTPTPRSFDAFRRSSDGHTRMCERRVYRRFVARCLITVAADFCVNVANLTMSTLHLVVLALMACLEEYHRLELFNALLLPAQRFATVGAVLPEHQASLALHVLRVFFVYLVVQRCLTLLGAVLRRYLPPFRKPLFHWHSFVTLLFVALPISSPNNAWLFWLKLAASFGPCRRLVLSETRSSCCFPLGQGNLTHLAISLFGQIGAVWYRHGGLTPTAAAGGSSYVSSYPYVAMLLLAIVTLGYDLKNMNVDRVAELMVLTINKAETTTTTTTKSQKSSRDVGGCETVMLEKRDEKQDHEKDHYDDAEDDDDDADDDEMKNGAILQPHLLVASTVNALADYALIISIAWLSIVAYSADTPLRGYPLILRRWLDDTNNIVGFTLIRADFYQILYYATALFLTLSLSVLRNLLPRRCIELAAFACSFIAFFISGMLYVIRTNDFLLLCGVIAWAALPEGLLRSLYKHPFALRRSVEISLAHYASVTVMYIVTIAVAVAPTLLQPLLVDPSCWRATFLSVPWMLVFVHSVCFVCVTWRRPVAMLLANRQQRVKFIDLVC